MDACKGIQQTEEIDMKKILATIALAAIALPLMADYYVAGDFQGWNAGGNVMTQTAPGSGVWVETFTGLGASARHEFKITDGTWNNAWPGSGNSWLYADGSGNVTITYNANTCADGWPCQRSNRRK